MPRDDEVVEEKIRQNQMQANYRRKNMLLTLKQFADKYPWPTVTGLRNWHFRSQQNAHLSPLRKCFKKVGSRVLVDDEAFFNAVAELNDDRG